MADITRPLPTSPKGRRFEKIKMLIFRKSLNLLFKDFLFITVFCCSASQFSAQVNFVDSIGKALHKKPRLIATLSTRHTFIDNVSSPVYNIKAGLNFDNVFRLGCGYAFLKKPYQVTKAITSSGSTVYVDAQLKFSYANFFVEYVFHKTPKWEFSVPLFFGIGSSYLKYNYNNYSIKDNKRLILLYEPVVSGHYKVFPWLGVGGDIGYRLMLVSNKSIENRFNSPIYGFRVMLFLHKFVHHVVDPVLKKYKSR